MISVSKNAGMALLLMMLAAPAYAQVCMETGGSASGKANMQCDMSYRDQIVACDAEKSTDVVGTRPSCPPKPMPMIDTPKKSYIADYTPYLWHYPRDASGGHLPYAGAYALGTPGDTSRTFQLFGNTAPGTKRLASCTAQIHVPTDPTTLGDWAKLTRLEVDNCTNQYIINAAMYPFQKESTKILSMDDPAHPGKPLNAAGECQPLKTFTESEDEYDAGHYIQVAWQKTMQDASYRSSTPSAIKCVPCVGGIQACDKEPHLPCAAPQSQGTTLDNPIKPPAPFPEVRLSSISTIKYENINDPTHPFSPRWDYLLNDRDYSNLDQAQLALVSPTALAINTAMTIYMTKEGMKSDVFCAGVKKSSADESDSGKKKKADDEVRVDILKFRADAFNDALTKRTAYNAACYKNVGQKDYPSPHPFSIPQFIVFVLDSYCFRIVGFSPLPPTIYAYNKPCWKCFGLDGQVDDESQHPPCTTNYVGKDLSMKGVIPGGLASFSIKAACHLPGQSSPPNMPKLCSDTRRPYTSLNVLKMRYNRTDTSDDNTADDNKNNNALAKGAVEGMTFKEYFGNHMPYPRMWDMGGVSLQNTRASDMKSQPPTDTTGQYTAIVGIGREAATKVAGGDPDKHKDERCLTGGWGGTGTSGASLPAVTFGGVTLQVPDAMTSWTEMKLYQARTLRNIGMACIGRYEKVFKPGSAENMMLLRAGGRWQQLIITKCDKDKNGLTKNCKAMNYKEYTDAGSPANTDSTFYIKNVESQDIPQPWRGYLSADDTNNKFPTWGKGSPSTDTGLDKATQGDIIIMPNGPKDDASSGNQGLPKLAFVIETRLDAATGCDKTKDCYVRVLEPDNGKWPDSCGTTDTWGEMKTRYYYKPGDLPVYAQQEYDRIGSVNNCIETKISHCEQTAWSSLKVYHIRDDTRTGCDKATANECKDDDK